MEEEIKYPKIIVGAFIFNDQGELLLMKGVKWHDKYSPPGGKIEAGETLIEAVKREVKEETNLEIDNIEFVGVQDGLIPEGDYTLNDNQLVFIDYKAVAKDPENLKLNEEANSSKWLPIGEWLKKNESKFTPYTYNVLKKIKDAGENLKHKYLLALADYQNLLKRTAAEKQEYVKYANEQSLHEILPVYDNLKLAVAHAKGDENGNSAVIEGVKYVLSQFKSALDGMGVREIKTIGEKYDHHAMEAMEEKETDDESKDGLVESEIMPGYKLADRVIRAARVAVYRHVTHNT